MSFESLQFESKPKIDTLKKIKACNNLSDKKFNVLKKNNIQFSEQDKIVKIYILIINNEFYIYKEGKIKEKLKRIIYLSEQTFFNYVFNLIKKILTLLNNVLTFYWMLILTILIY